MDDSVRINNSLLVRGAVTSWRANNAGADRGGGGEGDQGN